MSTHLFVSDSTWCWDTEIQSAKLKKFIWMPFVIESRLNFGKILSPSARRGIIIVHRIYIHFTNNILLIFLALMMRFRCLIFCPSFCDWLRLMQDSPEKNKFKPSVLVKNIGQRRILFVRSFHAVEKMTMWS